MVKDSQSDVSLTWAEALGQLSVHKTWTKSDFGTTTRKDRYWQCDHWHSQMKPKGSWNRSWGLTHLHNIRRGGGGCSTGTTSGSGKKLTKSLTIRINGHWCSRDQYFLPLQCEETSETQGWHVKFHMEKLLQHLGPVRHIPILCIHNWKVWLRNIQRQCRNTSGWFFDAPERWELPCCTI
jgi:hypothetical protein